MKKFVVKLSTVLVLMMVLASGSGLFWVSQKVQQLERDQRSARLRVSSEQEAIRVLAAEWDYLNRPDRLESLAVHYLPDMSQEGPENLLKDASAVPEKNDEDQAPTIMPANYDAKNSQAAKPLGGNDE